jgi:hypothetical protein
MPWRAYGLSSSRRIREARSRSADVASFSAGGSAVTGRSMRLLESDNVAFTDFLRNPFSFLFTRSSGEDRIAAYVIREHERGRPLTEILDDPYIKNRTTPLERERLLDKPEVVRALGHAEVEAAKQSS